MPLRCVREPVDDSCAALGDEEPVASGDGAASPEATSPAARRESAARQRISTASFATIIAGHGFKRAPVQNRHKARKCILGGWLHGLPTPCPR